MNIRDTHRLAVRLLPLVCFLLPACQQEMAVQPAPRPDEPSSFFADGRAARPVVEGTVARGHLRTDRHYFTGKRVREPGTAAFVSELLGAASRGPLGVLAVMAAKPDNDAPTFPFPIAREVLQHGKDRYTIYCVVCHDPLGTGRGKIVERGYTPPPSYHIERLRNEEPGHFFSVITEGYGSMPDYKQQIPPRDRWAIAAYVRALQLSQHYPAKELTMDMREEWDTQRKAAAGEQTP